eukprot:1159696-Pelagomonas_calceolata.AAC.8
MQVFVVVAIATTIDHFAVVCVGVAVATVTDRIVINNTLGFLVGLSSTVVTALYQVCVCARSHAHACVCACLLCMRAIAGVTTLA